MSNVANHTAANLLCEFLTHKAAYEGALAESNLMEIGQRLSSLAKLWSKILLDAEESEPGDVLWEHLFVLVDKYMCDLMNKYQHHKNNLR